MKCSRCGNRFYKATAEGTVFFFKRMLLCKSGKLVVVCNHCSEPCTPNAEMTAVLRSAVLVKTEGGGDGSQRDFDQAGSDALLTLRPRRAGSNGDDLSDREPGG
jgi:hypothetical protein